MENPETSDIYLVRTYAMLRPDFYGYVLLAID